jgi:tetratricopeptide (TPR) repeat protein
MPRVNVKEEPMRRRRFIASVVAATGAGLVPTSLAEAAVQAPDRLNGAVTLPTAINDIAGDIWRTGADYVDPRHAPARAEMLDVALWQWAQACVAADRSKRSGELHRKALAVEAEAARQCAMIYGDRRQPTEALKMYRLASAAAQRAGNHELTATILTGRAYQPLYAGQFDRCIGTATVALDHLEKSARQGGRAAVTAYALLARSYAALGDTTSMDQALRAAYGAMARYKDAGGISMPAPHHPQRFAWVKLKLATAEAYAAVGDSRRHLRAYEGALEDPSLSQMHRPMLDMGKAEVTHDPEAACHHALTVLRGYERPPNPIVGRARALALRAQQTAPRNETVQSLRIHLLKLR